MLRVLDLFSGIGGFSLGLERTGGFRTVAFCEIDPYCRAVLRKHWPAVPCFEDARDLHAFDVGPVDVICGGFPCQDISVAGRGAGLAGSRSGLWSEYRRLIEECRPAWVVIENVSALRSRGMDQVLGELTALGYDAEWHCIPAAAVGAPHRRDRVWIIAYALSVQLRQQPGRCGRQDRAGQALAAEHGEEREMAYADEPRLEGRLRAELRQCAGELPARQGCASVADAGCVSEGRPAVAGEKEGRRPFGEPAGPGWWLSEPDVGRVANGVPSRVDRLRALGNAVVPQIPEIIGRAILEAERCSAC